MSEQDRRLVRVAVPNKGALAESAAQMLREAGYRQRTDPKELVLLDEANGVEFFYLRPRDIAVYVGEGTLDVGITGRDMLLDSGAPVTEVLPLGFGRSRFRFAAPEGSARTVGGLHGLRVATSYPGLVGRYLTDHGVAGARLIPLDGAVETAIRLGVADVVADVVETGTTLRQAGLELFGEPLLTSEAVLVRRDGVEPDGLELLERRLNGVLIARNWVMMVYDVPDDAFERACAVTPGFEGPTVSPLAKQGWRAVSVMVPRAEAQRLMDELWSLGARAILVTDIAACRL